MTDTMYKLNVKPELAQTLDKLRKRNIKQYQIIKNKAQVILNNPHRYKNLRAPMNHLRRVHIDKHFVLVFSVDEESKTVTLVDYDHHDNIY
jgi:YafQ family addiction module toxin component